MNEIIIIVPLYALFLVTFYLFYVRRAQSSRLRRRFFRALKEILIGEKDIGQQEKQLNLIYKKLAERFSSSMSEIRHPTDLLEDFIYYYDARGDDFLKGTYNVEVDKSLRDSAYFLLEHIRSANPFSALPAKEASLLRTLLQAVESSNKDLATNSILQLAQDVEILASAVGTGERRTRIAYLISVVGVVLTIVFGLSSLLQRFF